jgi:hypothetical protein
MRKLSLFILFIGTCLSLRSHTIPTELQKLIISFIPNEGDVGAWGVGEPARYDVKWSADKVESSDDPAISFYRNGMTSAYYRGKTLLNSQRPISWAVTIKGPKEGFTNYSIVSSPSSELNDFSIESIFSKDEASWTLLQSCDQANKKFKFYEVKVPGKDVHYIRIQLIPRTSATAIRIDGYDPGSKDNADLNCE